MFLKYLWGWKNMFVEITGIFENRIIITLKQWFYSRFSNQFSDNDLFKTQWVFVCSWETTTSSTRVKIRVPLNYARAESDLLTLINANYNPTRFHKDELEKLDLSNLSFFIDPMNKLLGHNLPRNIMFYRIPKTSKLF